mmetsp:Transcript_57365/g.94867  ORF Transcript_57365/g.94867 Transcript_57365/m.94867 type:complete len:102 (+) Transcript_57365:228-533(+)
MQTSLSRLTMPLTFVGSQWVNLNACRLVNLQEMFLVLSRSLVRCMMLAYCARRQVLIAKYSRRDRCGGAIPLQIILEDIFSIHCMLWVCGMIDRAWLMATG